MSDREPVVSDWRGMPRYACPFAGCVFDSMQREKVEAHIAAEHRPPDPIEADPLPKPAKVRKGA